MSKRRRRDLARHLAGARPGATRQRVFEFVRQALAEGRPPTVREVQAALGFRAVETAREHLARLVAEGRLIQEEGVARGYRLGGAPGSPGSSGLPGAPISVPLLGRVQAGALSEAIEQSEEFLNIESSPPGFVARAAKHELFALRVRGESMIGAGILDGDVVIVRRQTRAENGEIVVARVGGEATVKTLRIARGRIELRPENPDFEAIVIDERAAHSDEAFELLGKVIEVRRYLESAQ